MDIPVIKVEGKGIAEVWEKSILELWKKGAQIKTEYDDPKDPPIPHNLHIRHAFPRA